MVEIMTKKEYCRYEDNYLRCTRCPRCAGTGEDYYTQSDCRTCNGTGRLERNCAKCWVYKDYLDEIVESLMNESNIYYTPETVTNYIKATKK
jgi:uncharacterized phage protein